MFKGRLIIEKPKNGDNYFKRYINPTRIQSYTSEHFAFETKLSNDKTIEKGSKEVHRIKHFNTLDKILVSY